MMRSVGRPSALSGPSTWRSTRPWPTITSGLPTGCAAAPQEGHAPGRASAHVGVRARQDLISSALATNLSGLRVSLIVGAKHDGEGGPAKKRPLRHLFVCSPLPCASTEPAARCPSHRLGGGPGSSLPVREHHPCPSQ